MRFEASYYAGDDDRLPEWCVVAWLQAANGCKVGRTVWKPYDMQNGEAAALGMADTFNNLIVGANK